MDVVSKLERKAIGQEIGVTGQAVGKNINNGTYERELGKWIIILNMAGYEIREKQE